MSTLEQSIHEVDFYGQIASAANMLFRDLAAGDPAAFPFGEARVEGFGTARTGGNGKTCESLNPRRRAVVEGRDVRLHAVICIRYSGFTRRFKTRVKDPKGKLRYPWPCFATSKTGGAVRF